MKKRIIEDIKVKKVEVFNPSSKNKFKVDLLIDDKIKSTKPFLSNVKISKKRLSKEPGLHKKPKKLRPLFLILFLVTFFIGLVFWTSIVFESVNIVITKKHQLFNLNQESLVASKELKSSIPFEIMIVSDKKSEQVNLLASEEVSLKAKGEITIYNEYSKKSEKLSTETYLSDENGKVYLTDRSISVPGYTLKEDEIIPGKVTVSVTSFLPGDVYNGNPTNFYINSFNGTIKYKKIYGKANTIFAGGAQGLNYLLNEQNKENLNFIANSSFKDSLLKKVNSLIPKEYIFYPNASSFSYEIEDEVLSKIPATGVNISGTLTVILLKEKDLINSLKKKLLPEASIKELSTINIIGVKNLLFAFTEKDKNIHKELVSTNFTLTGELDFIWNPQIIALKNNLRGSSREDLVSIFEKDIGIEDAVVKILPPWKSTLPLNIDKIKIKILSD